MQLNIDKCLKALSGHIDNLRNECRPVQKESLTCIALMESSTRLSLHSYYQLDVTIDTGCLCPVSMER